MEIAEEYKKRFAQEATILLCSADGVLLSLEDNPTDLALIGEIFRVIHTLKGVGGMYGYKAIFQLTHKLESVFDYFRKGQCDVNQKTIDITLKSVDHLLKLLVENALLDEEINKMHDQLLREIEDFEKAIRVNKVSSILGETTQNDDEKSTYNIIFLPHLQIEERKINLLNVFKDLLMHGKIMDMKRLNSDGVERWSIFFVGNCTKSEVEDALINVKEHCIFNKIADYDLFNGPKLKQVSELIQDEEKFH